MERKTKIHAEDGRQEIIITRDFELPLQLLFAAYAEAEIVEQWMGTKVLKLENRQHGGWRFETSNPQGIVVFSAHGVIHEFSENERIVRTFQMENTAFPAQIEYLNFEQTAEDNSRLTMHIVYQSLAFRDQQLALPFAQGINMAHNRLQEIVYKLK